MNKYTNKYGTHLDLHDNFSTGTDCICMQYQYTKYKSL